MEVAVTGVTAKGEHTVMARGKRAADPVRAQAAAHIIAGGTVADAARACEVARSTVYNWIDQDDAPREIVVKRMECRDLGLLISDYLVSLIEALTNQATIVGTKEYIESQPARDIALLHDSLAGKGFRLLEAMSAAQARQRDGG
jgi:hypothetical protein